MLNEYAHMLDYSNADRDSMLWGDAAQRVYDGTAAMIIVGDFGRGFFLSKGWKVGVELGEIPLRAPAATSSSSSTRSVCRKAAPTARRR